jgi:hypothetical protein
MKWIPRLITLLGLSLCLTSLPTFGEPSSVSDFYSQLKKIKHLNSPENIQTLDEIMAEIQSPAFEKLRAPFYAYAAKLATNDGNYSESETLLGQAVTALSALGNSDLIIDTLVI